MLNQDEIRRLLAAAERAIAADDSERLADLQATFRSHSLKLDWSFEPNGRGWIGVSYGDGPEEAGSVAQRSPDRGAGPAVAEPPKPGAT